MFRAARNSDASRLTDVVDGAVVAAEDEEGAGSVVAADGNHVLVLWAGPFCSDQWRKKKPKRILGRGAVRRQHPPASVW